MMKQPGAFKTTVSRNHRGRRKPDEIIEIDRNFETLKPIPRA
jgi:hypothetical protein